MVSPPLKIWIKAARPQTLPAGFIPVLVGVALAVRAGTFQGLPSITALACAMLIQIGTNFANDYFDYKKGADTEDRIGFERATATGQITAQQMKNATIITMGIAFLLGLYLVWHAGWVILAIGVISLLFGILYTGGPFPLGYNGLGDLFVFLFFGFIAVMGTYYVNALEWSQASLWASPAIGALATNILVVNNLRDIEVDKKAGKNTLGVLLGEQALRWEYLLMLGVSFSIPPHFFYKLGFNAYIYLPFVTLPLGVYLLWKIWTDENKKLLNKRLIQTGQFMTLFGLLFSLGIILDSL